ncbi:hypothetical protein FRAHR75_570038 [Frankia sp. Hr75.2]|nr:hypothetical protein FRAHR75_570038 [Frankia sp. Hr75.2]
MSRSGCSRLGCSPPGRPHRRWSCGCGCKESRPMSGVKPGGPPAVTGCVRGPASRPRPDDTERVRLAGADRGPAAHGWTGDQHWTLTRVATLIDRLFGQSYTLTGVAKLRHRMGYTAQRRRQPDACHVDTRRENNRIESDHSRLKPDFGRCAASNAFGPSRPLAPAPHSSGTSAAATTNSEPTPTRCCGCLPLDRTRRGRLITAPAGERRVPPPLNTTRPTEAMIG